MAQFVTIALPSQHSHSLLQKASAVAVFLFVLKSMGMTAARLSPGTLAVEFINLEPSGYPSQVIGESCCVRVAG